MEGEQDFDMPKYIKNKVPRKPGRPAGSVNKKRVASSDSDRSTSVRTSVFT
jgi:hypothetical protein